MVIKAAITLFAAGIALMYAFLIVSDCLIKRIERKTLESRKEAEQENLDEIVIIFSKKGLEENETHGD